MKLHLCCGDIFLRDFINADIRGALYGVDAQPDSPTTLENYYANRTVGKSQIAVVDLLMDTLQIPWQFPDASVDEIVMIQAIEHFTLEQADHIIREIERVLKPGGVLKIDFPNIDITVNHYIDRDPNFCMRLIYGSHKHEQHYDHLWGYTRETFAELLGAGWQIEWQEIVQHSYPTIGCKATWQGANVENLSRP